MSRVDLPTRIGLRVLQLHQRLYEGTDGRIGHRMLGTPCLLLTTTGRRTGKQRTAALVYARDGDDYLIVASMGGADVPPAWLHNLRAQPRVQVQVGRERFDAAAHVIERGDPEYARVWELVNRNNRDRYKGYQEKTTRPIPVVALRPT